MKLQLLKPWFHGGLAFALIVAAVYMLSNVLVIGADTNTTNTVTSDTTNTVTSDTTNTVTSATTNTATSASKETKEKKPAPEKLTGAELYAINCNRCHPERYPTEFNSAQWKTIITHMRVRANLPAKQAREILKYMQEEAGN
jgi:hypothetical protein